jgi:hypothetical protein
MNSEGARRLLTFRLDQERRQRLRARLAREGRTMSEVVTHGLRQYVATVLARGDDPPEPPAHGGAVRPPIPPRLPERVAARLRELRSSGRSELLSGTLAALNDAGWPLRSLAEALGISRQAVQARVRRALRAAAAVPAAAGGQRGRAPAAHDDQDRPHAACVGAPGRGRRGQLAHPGGGGDPGSLPQAGHGRRRSGATGLPAPGAAAPGVSGGLAGRRSGRGVARRCGSRRCRR